MQVYENIETCGSSFRPSNIWTWSNRRCTLLLTLYVPHMFYSFYSKIIQFHVTQNLTQPNECEMVNIISILVKRSIYNLELQMQFACLCRLICALSVIISSFWDSVFTRLSWMKSGHLFQFHGTTRKHKAPSSSTVFFFCYLFSAS